MSKGARLAAVLVGFLVAVGLLVGWIANYLRYLPPTIKATTVSSSPAVANLTLQTVGALGFGRHPTWVSYLGRSASGQWVHTTLYQVPANATVHVTVYEYDSQGPLRNPVWGRVQGTVGNVEYVNGKPVTQLSPGEAAHTFAVPKMRVYVPMFGVPSSATNLCSTAPCTPNFAHNTITFTIHTGAPGNYRWQCFIPCGLGYLDGNGGPMQTLGYMAGFLKVV